MIVNIKDNGMFLELLDHSKWAIYPVESEIVCSWQPGNCVEVKDQIRSRSFNYVIENTDTKQRVYAMKM